MNKTSWIPLVIIILLLSAGIVFFIIQNQKLSNQISKGPKIQSTSFPSPEAATQAAVTQTPSPKTSTLGEVKTAIVANTNQKDRFELLPFIKNGSVNFIIMSSSCCPPKTPEEAIDSLNYIDEGIPFDFDQNSTTVKTLKTKNERLTNAYVGLSKNKEQLVAFTLDSKNRITQIEVSASWKLY